MLDTSVTLRRIIFMSKYFCPVPWTFQAIRNNGDIRICCHANASKSKGIIRKPDGTAYNASTDSLQESWNAPFVKELRRSMILGKQHEMCQRCDREDEAGLYSKRQTEQSAWPEYNYAWAKRRTRPNGETQEQPFSFDLRFGNRCNLRCRMCGPQDSDNWYNDHVAVTGQEKFFDSHGEVKLEKNAKARYTATNKDYEWVNTSEFWQQIEEKIPHIRHVYIVGGEPLLIDEHYDFLQKCIDMGYADRIVIEYNTNGVALPKRALDIWSKFKTVKLGVSIDAVGDINHYIRYPSNFTAIQRNLHRLDKASPNIKTWIAVTVQMFNVFYLPEFVDWRLEQQFEQVGTFLKSKPVFAIHMLHNPQQYNIGIAPDSAKKAVADKFDQHIQQLTNRHVDEKYINATRSMYDSVVAFMNNHRYDASAMHSFWEVTQKLDAVREQSFEETLPEWYTLLKSSV